MITVKILTNKDFFQLNMSNSSCTIIIFINKDRKNIKICGGLGLW